MKSVLAWATKQLDPHLIVNPKCYSLCVIRARMQCRDRTALIIIFEVSMIIDVRRVGVECPPRPPPGLIPNCSCSSPSQFSAGLPCASAGEE